jgi:hypothetical protein
MVLNTHIMTAPTYIYESPDGGETVYRRISGSQDRELIKVSNAKNYTHWREICAKAESDVYLRDLLDRAEAYYRLKYEPEI